jgi:hypothetical protein
MEDYSEGPSGLQTVELTEGSGTAVKEGDLVTVCQVLLPSAVNRHSCYCHVQAYTLIKACHDDIAWLQVHFDTIYKGIDVASSRSARLLGGNRTLAEVRCS